MQPTSSNLIRRNVDIISVVIAAALVLLIPVLAMQVGDDVVWSWFDFLVAGTLLVGTGLLFVLATRKTDNPVYRATIAVALAAAFLFVWAQLAVGVFGD